ncbi:hypothetical protein Tco_0487329 [Tanacetum coccineum]
MSTVEPASAVLRSLDCLKEDLGKKLEVELQCGMMEGYIGWNGEEEVREVENKSKECLDGWVGASGGEVKGGGVVFRVSSILLGEILRDIMGESGGESFGVDRGGRLIIGRW